MNDHSPRRLIRQQGKFEVEKKTMRCSSLAYPTPKPQSTTSVSKPPQPLAPFSDTFAALKFSPAAPQIPSGGMTDSAPVRWSEDCLCLNISAPNRIF